MVRKLNIRPALSFIQSRRRIRLAEARSKIQGLVGEEPELVSVVFLLVPSVDNILSARPGTVF